MRSLFIGISALCLGGIAALPSQAAETQAPMLTAKEAVKDYAALVYVVYWDNVREAQKLQKAVDAFLATPSESTLDAAKSAWLAARDAYGQSEAFRFYEGPIDLANEKTGEEGPEARLNSWPLNEAYIDYVEGNPTAGIVQDTGVAITRATLTDKNQADDEADVATGWHAIEFLLWGQDLSNDGPGARSFKDYLPGDPVRMRRRAYLKEVTGLLVDDLKFLAKSWEPKKDNYAAAFVKDTQALSKIMTALATLSGFELASERMATALDSGDQEDEHSCFSDNTHKDFIANAKGMENVFFNTYGDEDKGVGPYDLLKAKDAALAEKLAAQIRKSVALIEALPHPIDREILATPEGSQAREKMEAAIASLQAQADLLKVAGKALGVSVEIISE